MDTVLISDLDSGKSTALVIGVIQNLKAALNDVPRAIIVVPDKDKAEVLKERFDEIGKGTNLRTFTVYEGPKLQKIKDEIYLGSDIIIGTIRRLSELYSNNGLNLNDLEMFIIEDAHDSLKAEHIAHLDRMFDIIPDAQHIVLSETISDRLLRFIEKYFSKVNLLENS
jgi:superfamily II DNA/RNA helicase